MTWGAARFAHTISDEPEGHRRPLATFYGRLLILLLRKPRAGFGDGRDKTPTPIGTAGVTPFAGGRASVVPHPELRHRLRRAVATDTDRLLEAGGGGRREGDILLRGLPEASGGDKTGYVATSGPDCWASSADNWR
jgi:hypothetical protein